jgi:leader peptidase (prepilin peptidase)/N-methyltransferase
MIAVPALAGLGLVIGSFLATIILRWPAGRSIGGRSACDGCGRTLAAIELIPLLSFVFASGRCRSCGSAISPWHPAIELAAAAIGAGAALLFPGIEALAMAIFGWTLLCLGGLDLKAWWLPDALTLPLLAAGLALGTVIAPPDLVARGVGAAAGFLLLTLVRLAYRRMRRVEGMGGGDPKLLAAIGAWLGWEVLPQLLFLAAVSGLSWAVIRSIGGERLSGSDRMPFGTCLVFGTYLTVALSPGPGVAPLF